MELCASRNRGNWNLSSTFYFNSLNYTSCLKFVWLQIVVLRPSLRFCGWFLVPALFGAQLWFRVLLLLMAKDFLVETATFKLMFYDVDMGSFLLQEKKEGLILLWKRMCGSQGKLAMEKETWNWTKMLLK